MDNIVRELVDATPIIFKDERTLTPLYAPKKVVERDELIREIVKNIRKLARNQLPNHMLILGNNGTGKTVTIRYIMSQIGEVAGFYYIHLHGSDEPPLYETMRNMADDCLCMLQAKAIPWVAVYDQFAESLALQSKLLVLVLDEFDYFVTGPMFKLLKKLSRNPNVCMIGITNDYNVLDMVDDPSFLSAFNPQRVEFPEYTSEELETILYARAEEALLPNTFDDVAIRLIAALTLQKRSGDARYALDLLKYSADNCTDSNRERITEADVRASVDRIELIYNVNIVTRLMPQLKRIMVQIIQRDEMKRAEVLNLYNKAAKRYGWPTMSRTKFSFYLSSLERKGIIERMNRGAGRGKGIERLVRLSPNLDMAETREALAEFE
jgi:cell division control protein 6